MLVFLRMRLVHLLRRRDVVLQIPDSMLPGLQSLNEDTGGLYSISRGHDWVVFQPSLTSLGFASGTASSSDTEPPVVRYGSVLEPGWPAFSGG